MRAIPTTFRAALEDPFNDDPPLVFLTLDHADFAVPIRVVWDVEDYTLSGDRYIGFPFEIVLPTDTDDAPRGRITIQNVDRSVGEAVRNLSGPPSVVIQIYMASDFDLSVVPRVALGIPQLCYIASSLYFRNVTVDVISASGDLTSWDYVNQPWPSKFATQGLLPPLFR